MKFSLGGRLPPVWLFQNPRWPKDGRHDYYVFNVKEFDYNINLVSDCHFYVKNPRWLPNKLSALSRTTQLWVYNIMKPTFLMMRFCRASHEGDWPLHIKIAEDMLPYMFAAHKYNYGQYGLFYVRSMTWLGPEFLDRFYREEQSLHDTLVSTMDSGVTSSQRQTPFFPFRILPFLLHFHSGRFFHFRFYFC